MRRLYFGSPVASVVGYENMKEISVSDNHEFKLKGVADNSVCAVKIHHVLETLGSKRSDPLLSEFLKELYRVCRPGAVIEIRAKHSNYLSSKQVPEIVNIVNEVFLSNFDKSLASDRSEQSQDFAFKHGIDFKLIKETQNFNQNVTELLSSNKLRRAEDFIAVFNDPNAVDYCSFYLMCNKGSPEALNPDNYAVTHWLDVPNFGMRIYDLSRGSMFGSRFIKDNGAWEAPVSLAFKFVMERFDQVNTPLVFANIGANLGWYTLLGAILTKNFKVHAFEPTPETLEILRENIAINDLQDRISVFDIALSDAKGEADFFIDNDNAGSNSLMLYEEGEAEQRARAQGVDGHKVIKVKTETLDNMYLNKPKEQWPNVILMDVEGHEQKVFDGAHQLFEKGFRPYIFVEFSPALMALRGSCTYYKDLVNKYGYNIHMADQNLSEVPVAELENTYNSLMNNTQGLHLDLLLVPSM